MVVIYTIIFNQNIISQNNFIKERNSGLFTKGRYEKIIDNSDSLNKSYYSYDKINFDIGYHIINKWKLSLDYFLNINYKISNFLNSLELYQTQLGLFNEAGINNLSIYTNVGPELRILRKYFLIPRIGVSFILATGTHKSGIAFIYYFGITSGLFLEITEKTDLEFEVGTDFLLANNMEIIFFYKNWYWL